MERGFLVAKTRFWLPALARLPRAPGMRSPHLQRTVKMSLPGLPNLAVCLAPTLSSGLGWKVVKEVTGSVQALAVASEGTVQSDCRSG